MTPAQWQSRFIGISQNLSMIVAGKYLDESVGEFEGSSLEELDELELLAFGMRPRGSAPNPATDGEFFRLDNDDERRGLITFQR